MTKHHHRLVLLFALVLGAAPEFLFSQDREEEIPDYIRFRTSPDKSGPDILETAVTRFRNGNHDVDLIAVVHLGDREYYRLLNTALKPYDAVFYEMVGGPYSEEKARLSKDAPKDSDLAQIHALQGMAKNILGLEFQLDCVDYLAANFVHADMSIEEFSRHSGGGQDFSGMLGRALQMAQSGAIEGLPATEGEANQLMMVVFGAMMTGNSNELKRTLAPILSRAESFISQLEEEESSVLITKRNQIVIDRMRQVVAAEPEAVRTDAVLYGAGHMPGIEGLLRKLGYEKISTRWEPSWTIDQGAPETPAKTPDLRELTDRVGNLLDAE